MSLTAISPSLLYQNVENLTFNLFSPDSSYFSQASQVSFNSDFLLVNPVALSPYLGSSERLYFRAEFAISLCTEEDVLNAIETAVCNLYQFYWCFKRILFSC